MVRLRHLHTSEIKDHKGIFAGGDCVTGPATVIRAIAAGKVAAANIDEYLRLPPSKLHVMWKFHMPVMRTRFLADGLR